MALHSVPIRRLYCTMILHLFWTFSPALPSMTLLFCPFLHFLCPTVKHGVSQDTCSLSGHAALGFLMHSEDLNGSPDTDDSQSSISRSTLIQIQIHLLSTKYVSGSVGVPLLSRQRGTLSKWSLILIALTELRCWPLCLSLYPPSPAACPYSIILTLVMLGLNNLP